MGGMPGMQGVPGGFPAALPPLHTKNTNTHYHTPSHTLTPFFVFLFITLNK